MEPQPIRARLRLRRLPSDYTLSFMTGTNSTMSGIRGPGRFLYELLRAGGRKLEDGLARVATRMGYGPTAAVRRFLVVIGEIHDQNECEAKLQFSTLEPSFPALLEAIRSIRDPCAGCGLRVALDYEYHRFRYWDTGAAQTLLAQLLRFLKSDDFASQLLSIKYLYAFSEMDWFFRGLFFHEWDGVSALEAIMEHAEIRVLEGRVEWEAFMLPTQQTLVQLAEDRGPTQLLWRYLSDIGDSHDRRRGCEAKLNISKLEPDPAVMLQTVQKLDASCAECLLSYQSLTSWEMNRISVEKLVRSLGTGALESRLLSARYIHALVSSQGYSHYVLIQGDAIPTLEANLVHARTHMKEGHVEWASLIHPTQETLTVLTRYQARLKISSTLVSESEDEDIVTD